MMNEFDCFDWIKYMGIGDWFIWKHAIVLSLPYCVIINIYSCEYLHVRSDGLTVCFVIYPNGIACVFPAIVSLC